MKILSTKTHGIIDYLMALVLISSPWLFNFDRNGAETWVPVGLGIGVILYSLITDYELGVSGIISMRTHLIIDILGGALLAASPWLFGFHDYVSTPHVILGIAEIGGALLTKTHPAGETHETSRVQRVTRAQ